MHIPVSKIKHQERGVDVPLLIWLYGKEERKKQIWKWRGKEINKEIDNYMTNLLNSIEKKKKKELYKNSLNLISCPSPPTKELKIIIKKRVDSRAL